MRIIVQAQLSGRIWELPILNMGENSLLAIRIQHSEHIHNEADC